MLNRPMINTQFKKLPCPSTPKKNRTKKKKKKTQTFKSFNKLIRRTYSFHFAYDKIYFTAIYGKAETSRWRLQHFTAINSIQNRFFLTKLPTSINTCSTENQLSPLQGIRTVILRQNLVTILHTPSPQITDSRGHPRLINLMRFWNVTPKIKISKKLCLSKINGTTTKIFVQPQNKNLTSANHLSTQPTYPNSNRQNHHPIVPNPPLLQPKPHHRKLPPQNQP